MGDRAAQLQQACVLLHQHPAITIRALSSLYHTAPVGFTAQAWFFNAVARLQTSLSPEALLSVTQAVERRLGRVPSLRWGPRPLDLDILLYDALCIQKPFLTVPHAALHERLFVLLPLFELAPDLRLPGGASIAALLAALPNSDSVRRLGPFPWSPEGGHYESPGTPPTSPS